MGWYRYIRFSPVSWTTLDRVDVGGMTEYPSFYYCIAVYIALIVILSAFIIVHIRKAQAGKRCVLMNYSIVAGACLQTIQGQSRA